MLVLLGLNPPAPLAVHIPVVVPPLTLPVKEIVPALEHNPRFGPAFTTASVLIPIIIVSETAKQFPLFVEVKVSVTEPAAISAELGVYVPLSTEEDGLKDPLPDVVQFPVVEPPAIIPLRLKLELLQMVCPVPAFTTGAGVIVITKLLVAGGQDPLFVDVSVIVTEPADISALLGTYEVLRFVVDENVPVPEEDHTPVLLNPVTLPDKVTVLLFAHTVEEGLTFVIDTF